MPQKIRVLASLTLFGLVLSTGPGIGQEQEPQANARPAANVPSHLRSARATMRTFLTAVVNDKLDRAAECLDWSAEAISPELRRDRVRQLKAVIDRMAWGDYTTISDLPSGEAYRFPPGDVDAPISIAPGVDGAWRFSSATVSEIPELHERSKDLPLVVRDVSWYYRMTPLGMEVWRILALFLSILGAWILGRVLRAVMLSTGTSLERRERHYAAVTMQSLAKAVVPLVLVFGLRLGLQALVLPPAVQAAADTVVGILIVIAVAYVIWRLVDVVDIWLHEAAARTSSKLDDMLAPMICSSIRVTIVVLTLVEIATIVSDKPPSAIIAGLGVGGLAIGLAAQDMIKNFFGSLMIFSDRPFELGERVQINNYDGTVESVGFRSTRVRTMEGYLVTVPNGQLANQPILNVSQRPNIRRTMKLGLTYDTTPAKIREALAMLAELLADHEGQDAERPPRMHFNEFGDFALVIQVTYWYHPADWWAFSDFAQQLNLEILDRFNAAGIEMAFPTQTIHVKGESGALTQAQGI